MAYLIRGFCCIFLDSRDVSEVGGLIAMSFGEEDIDRYTVVYKKDHGPSEDEIHARRNGVEWNEDKAKEYAQKVWNLDRSEWVPPHRSPN